jgi:hypothetical protein
MISGLAEELHPISEESKVVEVQSSKAIHQN